MFALSEAAHAGQLRICRISSSSSSVNGDEEVFLLCDKVQKGLQELENIILYIHILFHSV